MSGSVLRACVLAACDAVEGEREALGELDGIAGDGDHGMTMSIGARNVRARLAAAPDADGADLVKEVMLGMGSVGGAIGPIYATGLLKVLAELKTEGAAGRPIVAFLRDCAEAAEAAIGTLGKSKVGDKTILDALHPMAEALRAAAEDGADLADAIDAAARSARDGAEATSGMIATMGRASRLGERSRGFADPGATSFAVIVEALARAYRHEAADGRGAGS